MTTFCVDGTGKIIGAVSDNDPDLPATVISIMVPPNPAPVSGFQTWNNVNLTWEGVTGPTDDDAYDELMARADTLTKHIKTLVKLLNNGGFIPGGNLTNAQLKALFKVGLGG